MDVKHVNPFIESFSAVMPQLGFETIQRGNLSIKQRDLTCSGAVVIVGIVGAIKGNVVYCIDLDHAKSIASTMMMGMPVEIFDDMAQSAISELSNMITANAAIVFEGMGIPVQISPPTMVIGDNVYIRLSKVKTIAVLITTEAGEIELNIGIEV